MVDELGQHDARLAQQAAAGCEEPFARLARRHQLGVRHYVHRLARRTGQGDADDVVQEAFLKAWQRIGDYDSHWAFSTWLFTIARRAWLNQERARQRRRHRATVAATVRPHSGEAGHILLR